jgi:hypothetical protein
MAAQTDSTAARLLSTGLLLCAALLAGGPVGAQADTPRGHAPHIATFSIVARDPAMGDLGVAAQSKYFGVGSVVPHARADTSTISSSRAPTPSPPMPC